MSECNLFENLLCSQNVPSHPGLQPNSQTPSTALQLIQLDPHFSMQFLPKDPFIHPKDIEILGQNVYRLKILNSIKVIYRLNYQKNVCNCDYFYLLSGI